MTKRRSSKGTRALLEEMGDLGDLVNPVYDNLNLLNGLGEALYPDYPAIPEYPFIENQETRFLRK